MEKAASHFDYRVVAGKFMTFDARKIGDHLIYSAYANSADRQEIAAAKTKQPWKC